MRMLGNIWLTMIACLENHGSKSPKKREKRKTGLRMQGSGLHHSLALPFQALFPGAGIGIQWNPSGQPVSSDKSVLSFFFLHIACIDDLFKPKACGETPYTKFLLVKKSVARWSVSVDDQWIQKSHLGWVSHSA